jgi:hypothetical protein
VIEEAETTSSFDRIDERSTMRAAQQVSLRHVASVTGSAVVAGLSARLLAAEVSRS